MLVTLIGKNVLYKLILPHKKTGNYWITNSDDGKKLVNIIGKNNEWNIYSNEQAKILDPRAINSWNISKIVKNKANIFSEIKLQENGIYYISLASNPNMLYILLCEPTYERDFIQLNAKNFQEITIGRKADSDIIYNNSLIKQEQARIFYSNGKLMVENFDESYGTFLNDLPVANRLKLLFNGDIIFIMGLRIIIVGNNVFINNPFNRVTYNLNKLEIVKKENRIITSSEVTDEDVEAELKKEQEKNSRTITVEDRAAQNGDTATIDFEGFVDGEAFEGGKGTDYPLTLGSNTFIPGFEEQLVGANTGDHVEVKVTFPEEYQAKELAGKEAVFQCDVKKIEAKELPELDDDFAKDVSEFDTLAEYKEDVKKNLTEKKAEDARRAKEDAAVDKVIENAQMDIPEAMIETQTRQMLDDFARRMQSQGLSMEQYFQFTGQSVDKMMEDMKPQALKRIQTRLVLEKIAEVENIQPTEEEVNEEISKMAEMYKMEADKLKDLIGENEMEQMKKDMAVQKAVTLVADAAVEA